MICAARGPPMVGDNVGYKGPADNSERGVNMLTTQTSLQNMLTTETILQAATTSQKVV